MKRGHHRIYLGYAPGVGKTYAMLREANRLFREGVDVVVGYVETYGRKETEEQMGNLPFFPRRRILYKGVWLEEMDLEGLLERRPQLVLVDELPHTNAPGSRHHKRYEDVEDLLRAGVDVFSTLNVQHLESLNDKVYEITGVRVRETVPDRVMVEADEVVLVDVTPEILEERLRQGKIYPDARRALALRHFFRHGNLLALRELALEELAGEVDLRLEEHLDEFQPGEPPRPEERILVAVTPRPLSAQLIRRGWRIAHRLQGKLYVLHVEDPSRPLAPEERGELEKLFVLARELGGEPVLLRERDPVTAILRFAQDQRITQVVVGQGPPSRWPGGRSPTERILRLARGFDLLVVAEARKSEGEAP